jgi:hypothetical protein
VLQVSGSILYNGHNKDEFVVERTTAFVDQVRPGEHAIEIMLLSLGLDATQQLFSASVITAGAELCDTTWLLNL